MKFVCDRCQTKYSIADERVRGKVLKVKCKTCANVITVREARQPSAGGLPTLSSGGAGTYIYGPNTNVKDGLPLICDVRRFCRHKGPKPASVVDNLPNNYNIAVRTEFYEELLHEYSFAYDLDLENDIIVVMLLNEIEFGFAHGATDPQPKVPGQPVERPIRHIEQQYTEEAHYEEWYSHYGLKITPATGLTDAASKVVTLAGGGR